MKRYYPIIHKLHAYFGLFISPFVLVYCFAVLGFNHAGLLNRITRVSQRPDIKTKLDKISVGSTDLETAKTIIKNLGIDGEVDFISKGKDRFSFPVYKPGLKSMIEVNTQNDSVFIYREQQGTFRAMSFLHKMPGPHNEMMRGNSLFIKIWRVFTNVVVYVLLFLSASGFFLWYFLKMERILGLFAIALGFFCLTGLFLLIF